MKTKTQKRIRNGARAVAWPGLLVWVVCSTFQAHAAEPASYGVGFVASPAVGWAMNDKGIIAGMQYKLPPGCTPATCAGVPQAVVWLADTVKVLPLLPGFPTVWPVGINAGGWVAGYAGDPWGTGARALVWKPTSSGYAIIDLGVIPGTNSSWAAGIDDQGRVVGWSTTGGAIPAYTAPFAWSEAGGLVDLSAQGFPNEIPLAISPGGTVATSQHWYRLGLPGSVKALAPPPSGFSGPGNYPAAINDSGDQARFLVSTSSQFLPYLFRYGTAGTWQQIWSTPAGHLAPYGLGSINAAGDITATVNGVGIVAYGPNGSGSALASKLSPAYGGGPSANVTLVPSAGPITNSGQILARVMIGRSPRLARLLPASACQRNCIQLASIEMTGKMIGVPPGQCTPVAFNWVTATLLTTDEMALPLWGATIYGRFLDDYYLNSRISGTTDVNGRVRFVQTGPACTGATAFLVDAVTMRERKLDKTTGELWDDVIPQP